MQSNSHPTPLEKRHFWSRGISMVGLLVVGMVAYALLFYSTQHTNNCGPGLSWFRALQVYSFLGLVGCPLGLAHLSDGGFGTSELHFFGWAGALISLLVIGVFAQKRFQFLASFFSILTLLIVGYIGAVRFIQAPD